MCHRVVFAGCSDCQSNVELIRQLLTERTVLDRERQRFVAVTDINILAAATSPGLPGELWTVIFQRTSLLSYNLLSLFYVILCRHSSCACPYHFCTFFSRLVMAALCNRGPLYFCPVVSFYLSTSSFFPRLISAATDWMSTVL